MGSRGPTPTVPSCTYRNAVGDLHDPEHDIGVPARAVAVYLRRHGHDIADTTASKHLKRLYDDGALEREKSWPGAGRPKWYYKPSNSA